MNKLKIPYPIIVEGRYDRQRLLCVADAHIITTDGFGIFKKKEKLALLRRLSENTKIIVLSDSDGAGKLIRSHIGSAIPPDRLIQLYIPQIKGKEKRKSAPSKEGTLGVEGMDDSLLRDLFAPFAADSPVPIRRGGITKADLYALSLTGVDGATENRNRIAVLLGLPKDMTPGAFLDAINILYDKDSFTELVESHRTQEEPQ